MTIACLYHCRFDNQPQIFATNTCKQDENQGKRNKIGFISILMVSSIIKSIVNWNIESIDVILKIRKFLVKFVEQEKIHDMFCEIK